MSYTAADIASVIAPQAVLQQPNSPIEHLLTDSRRLVSPATTIFFALPGSQRQGNQFINGLYKAGVCHFVITAQSVSQWPDANFYVVNDVLNALQKLAAHHRARFTIPVIGITGSNGKTIVKEWLYQLLHTDYLIVRSPKSYNSQVGVPVSVWQMNQQHTLAIFEAGISTSGEMAALETIIKPTIGILTNIGEAHSEGFASMEDKLIEKHLLFKCTEITIGAEKLLQSRNATFTWGTEHTATLQVISKSVTTQTTLKCRYRNNSIQFVVPFTDEAAIENAITCCAVLLYLGYNEAEINRRLATLHQIDMRLQLAHGSNGCTIINDSYSADLTSLQMALHFLAQQKSSQKRTVILSDFIETGKGPFELYDAIATMLMQHDIQRVIAIGDTISDYLLPRLEQSISFKNFTNTETFLQGFKPSDFSNELILIKGARRFGFERIVATLETKVHQTVLEINLNALAHNLKQYQSLLQPGTKTMAMVKAFAYGSGSAEIAGTLQFHGIDYLGVAYSDEGIELRKAGINIPVMVMNADEAGFAALTEHGLQPVLFTSTQLNAFQSYVLSQGLSSYPIHIELETGMHRLGFEQDEIESIIALLHNSPWLKVQSLFSHLAASEDAAQDAFTFEQASRFMSAAVRFEAALGYPVLKHIANSAAIIRHPELQFDMVRLGIGLYGVEIATQALELQPVATLRSTIAQLKNLHPGDTVSYGRRGVVKEEALIATVRIGYADGYDRRLSNGVGKMWVNGYLAPVIGTVCMDMTMLDVSHIPSVKEGDKVVIFGEALSIQQLADWCGSIPYEIMTSISQRVKRVYFQE